MPKDTANSIEQQLELQLPESLKRYFSEFPFNGDMSVVRQSLAYEPETIVKTTAFFRKDGFFEQVWPHNFLVVGGDNLGNEFFLNIDDENSAVFLADHEACCNAEELCFEQVEENLDLWIRGMLSTEEWFKANPGYEDESE